MTFVTTTGSFKAVTIVLWINISYDIWGLFIEVQKQSKKKSKKQDKDTRKDSDADEGNELEITI